MTAATPITGIHPYADKFPMLPDAELDELAGSIASNGLRNPIVITVDGLILDGRNRYAACERAEVEPTFITYEGDDLAEYVIDCNSSRRHMATGARAMATALVLSADGRRGDGRWKRGSILGNDESVNTGLVWAQRLKECGIILDFAPALAREVVDGNIALDAAYRKACEARDAERLKLEETQRITAEEADAKNFVEATAPDLAAMVGDTFQTFAEAQAVWEKRNREEAARLATEKAKAAADEAAELENAHDHVRVVARALIGLDGMKSAPWRIRTRDYFAKYGETVPPTRLELHDPTKLRQLAGWINTYADELEGH